MANLRVASPLGHALLLELGHGVVIEYLSWGEEAFERGM